MALAKPATRTKIEVGCATLSLTLAGWVAALLAVHIATGTSPAELTCTYINGAVYGIVGILVTVNDVSQVSWTGSILGHGWSKWRGPVFFIGGILLELLSTVAWLHMAPA